MKNINISSLSADARNLLYVNYRNVTTERLQAYSYDRNDALGRLIALELQKRFEDNLDVPASRADVRKYGVPANW